MVIYKTPSVRTIIGRTKTKKGKKKNRKWRNSSRTDLQPAERCKSMVVSGSHWNLLICYDIVLYMVWNTDSFPLDWFCSLNLFLCLCLLIPNLVPCKFRWHSQFEVTEVQIQIMVLLLMACWGFCQESDQKWKFYLLIKVDHVKLQRENGGWHQCP